MSPKLVSQRDLAKLIGVSTDTLSEWQTPRGGFYGPKPVGNKNGYMLYNMADVRSFLLTKWTEDYEA